MEKRTPESKVSPRDSPGEVVRGRPPGRVPLFCLMHCDRDNPPRISQHVPELDGIRGIAILIVMLGHFTIGFTPATSIDKAVMILLQTGWAGVDLFFVLSGFLITGILIDARGAPHYFRNFYARRVLRIFPAYYIFLVLFFVVAPITLGRVVQWPFEAWRSSQWWFWSYASNLQILFPGWVRPEPLSHFWSLAVEEQFYLFWPAVVLLATPKWLVRICFLFLVGCVVLRIWMHLSGINPTAGYRITPARLDTLGAGALLAIGVRRHAVWETIRRWPGRGVVVSLSGLLAIAIPDRGMLQGDFAMQAAGYSLLALLGVCLIVSSVDPVKRDTRLNRFLRNPIMLFLGKYSYAMYIIHFPLDWAMENLGWGVSRFPVIMGSAIPAMAMFAVLAGSITAVLALASWVIVEKPLLKLKKFFPRPAS
ncbi:MAG: acyltransferase [Gemmatimonadaceae bacterium]